MTESGNETTPDSPGAAPAPVAPEQDAHAATQIYAESPAYFTDMLEDSERLLKYAAEFGIEIDQITRDHVLQARSAASSGAWTEQTAANLITALTML